MRDMGKMLGSRIKPEAVSKVFCSSLQFVLRYKALLYEFREKQTNTTEEHGSQILKETRAKLLKSSRSLK